METERRLRPTIRTAMQMSAVPTLPSNNPTPFSSLQVFLTRYSSPKLHAPKITARKSHRHWGNYKERLKSILYPQWESDQCVLEEIPKLTKSETGTKLPRVVRSEAPSPVSSTVLRANNGKVVLFRPRKLNRVKTDIGLKAAASPVQPPATVRAATRLSDSPVPKSPLPPAKSILQPLVRFIEIDSQEFDSDSSTEQETRAIAGHYKVRSEM